MTEKEIKTEVKRLKDECIKDNEGTDFELGFIAALENVEVLIDNAEEPSNDNLEEAAMNWVENNCFDCDIVGEHCSMRAFKEGANWQRKQIINKACEWLNMFYSEDRHCYLVKEDIDGFRKAMED